MERGPQFPETEITYFTKERFPDLPENLRVPMQRAKNAMDAKQAREAEARGELPGMPAPENNSPVCGDCALPMQATYEKPQLRTGKAPMYPWYCNRHGTIYHPQRPPSRS